MFCYKCGTQISNGGKFCSNCGTEITVDSLPSTTSCKPIHFEQVKIDLEELIKRFEREPDPDNDQKIFELANKIVEVDDANVDAKYILAQCYQIGIGTEKINDKAVELYKQLVDTDLAGSMEFQYKYASALEENQDPACLSWYFKLSCGGDQLSTYTIGSLLLESNLMVDIPYKRRFEAASVFLEKAAQMSDDSKISSLATDKLAFYKVKNEIKLLEIERQELIMSSLK